jgi:hypothetical protein
MNHFMTQLRDRVTNANARMIMDTALVHTGLQRDPNEFLSSDEAKTLCLALIKQGGPAFKVGQALYRNIQ